MPRLVAYSLNHRLRVMPAVVVTGARQTGKSTLVQDLAPGDRLYFSLDDLDVVDAARRDVEALVGGTRPVTLDEVQREPDLLQLSAVASLPDFRRLMRAACFRLGCLVNQTELGRDARLERADLFYWRTTIGEEVDFVIEANGSLIPIEVKASGRPRLRDARHLRTFRAEYGSKARSGIILHTGKTLEWIAPDVLAVPWWRIL